jgi:hypothetical protein
MPATPIEKSAALTDAVQAPGSVSDQAYPPEQAAASAAEYGEDVPLPRGWNSAARLDWFKQNGGQAVSTTDIQSLVQHNAIADWISYAAGQPSLTADERTILAQLPDWPVVRGSEWGEAVLRPMVQALLSGDRSAATRFAEGQARIRALLRP